MKTLILLFLFTACNDHIASTVPVAESNIVPTPGPSRSPSVEPKESRIVPVVVNAQQLAEVYEIEISPLNGGYSYSPYNYDSLCVKLPVSKDDAMFTLQRNAENLGGDILHFFELEVNRSNALEYLQYLEAGGEKLRYPKKLTDGSCDEHGAFKDSLQSIHGVFISECMKIPLYEFDGATQNDRAIAQDALCNKNR